MRVPICHYHGDDLQECFYMRYRFLLAAMLCACALSACSGYGNSSSSSSGITIFGDVDASVVHTR